MISDNSNIKLSGYLALVNILIFKSIIDIVIDIYICAEIVLSFTGTNYYIYL